ncbi:uncharacterized protein LOC110440404 [Mizuhopecten yessoensis]|nr:uncharacterized protein LOC110440404 [Mizuhopecten yessoensis]
MENGKDASTTERGKQDTKTGSDDNQIEETIKSLRKENTVDVKTLSSYKNKRISAEDKRPSARAFGVIGGLILSLLCSMIVLSDIPKMITDWRKIHRLVKPISNLEKTNNMLIRTHYVPIKYSLGRRSSL